MDTLRPRSDAKRGSGAWLAPGPPASRTQRGQGRRRRSSARVFSVGIDFWKLLRSGGKKDTARPGSTLGSDAWGNCGDVEAASLRRDRKPARVEAAARLFQAVPQAWRKGQSAWRTPTRASRTKRKTHSVPGVQRKKRSTPAAEQVSSGRSDQLQPPDGCPAEEGLITPTAGRVQREKGLSLQPTGRGRERRAYHSVHRPVLRAKGLITSHWQHSLVGDLAVQPGLRD